MVLDEEKKQIILKRLRKSALKKLLVILISSFIIGIVVMILLCVLGDADMRTLLITFEAMALLMLLLQLDDFLIAVCMLLECGMLKGTSVKYDIVKADKIGPSIWPFHLGSRMLNHKQAVYEYEGKKRTRQLWADTMVRNKDNRLFLLIPEKKPKRMYAFPFVEFLDIIN